MFKFVAHSGYWNNLSNQELFMQYAAKKFGVTTHQDWYAISADQFRRVGGSRLLDMYNGSLIQLLRVMYPQHVWRPYRFTSPLHMTYYGGKSPFSKTQYLLFQQLKTVSGSTLNTYNY